MRGFGKFRGIAARLIGGGQGSLTIAIPHPFLLHPSPEDLCPADLAGLGIHAGSAASPEAGDKRNLPHSRLRRSFANRAASS